MPEAENEQRPVADVVGLMRRYEDMTPDTAENIIRSAQRQEQVNTSEDDQGLD